MNGEECTLGKNGQRPDPDIFHTSQFRNCCYRHMVNLVNIQGNTMHWIYLYSSSVLASDVHNPFYHLAKNCRGENVTLMQTSKGCINSLSTLTKCFNKSDKCIWMTTILLDLPERCHIDRTMSSAMSVK